MSQVTESRKRGQSQYLKAFRNYLALLAIWIGPLVIAVTLPAPSTLTGASARVTFFMLWGLLIYPTMGVLCTVMVTGPLVRFHPVWNTIRNRANFNLKVILTWVVYVPFLLMSIGIGNLGR